MKYVLVLGAAVVAINASAVVILFDPFDNGDLATYTTGINAGFTTSGSGGSAEEFESGNG